MSSFEANYVAVAGCCAQFLWIKSQLADYDVLYDKVPIFYDNTSAISISNNPLLHSRTKHIDISAKADSATKTITFTLSCFDKPLSFNLDVFSTVIGLRPNENCVSIPPKETVKASGSHDKLNVNQQIIVYYLCWWLEIDIAEIFFSDLIASLHPLTGKLERKANICYIRYLSLIMEHLLKDAYKSDNLMSLKPHHITSISFKSTLENDIALTAHVCKVAELSPDPIKTLLPSCGEVNANNTTDKKSSPSPQVVETQLVEETMAIADATQSLRASKSADDQINQPQTTNAEKETFLNIRGTASNYSKTSLGESDEVKGCPRPNRESIMDEYDQKNKAAQEVLESPYDTDFEIKIIKRFQPCQPTDNDQITFLGSEPFHMEINQTNSAKNDDSDSGLRSMLDNDLISLIGFETADSTDDDSKEGTAKTFNASADMPAPSDPLGHLHEELRTLNTKFDQLESNISKKVTDDIQRWIRRIGNYKYAFSCEDLALIRRISFPGYDLSSWIRRMSEGEYAVLGIVNTDLCCFEEENHVPKHKPEILNMLGVYVAELKDMLRALLLDKKNQYSAQTSSPTPASIKAIEPNCVTCGDNHVYQNCPETSGNVYQDNIQEYVSQATSANFGQGNTSFCPQMVAN
nr:uncharacterized mitochondrial protein AtMg00810-like [Tanacetum cinerariifolium]